MKSIKLNYNINVLHDEDAINFLLKDIKLKKPLSNYHYFIKSKFNEIKLKKDNINKDKIFLRKFFITNIKKFSKLWKSMSEKDKNVYRIQNKKEKIIYQRNLMIINTYIFKGLNTLKFKKPTAYRLFLNIELINGLESIKEKKLIKDEARKKWKLINKEHKINFRKIKKINDIFIEKALKTNYFKPIEIYVKDLIIKLRNKHFPIPNLKCLSTQWKKLSEEQKNKYIILGNKDRIDEYKYIDIYELVNGLKPKLPKSGYQIFLKEKAIIKGINSIDEGRLKWKKLSNNDKNRYYLIFNRIKLAYEYKNIIYRKKINKFLPKKPGGPFQFYMKEKKGIKLPSNENPITYWSNEYNKLNKEEKKNYIQKSEKALKEYKNEIKHFKNMEFFRPKKPLNSFLIYFIERFKELTRKNTILNSNQKLKKIAKEWKEDKNIDKKKYSILAENEKILYIKRLKEFNQLGYYLKSTDKNIEKNKIFIKTICTKDYVYTKCRPKLKDKSNFNFKNDINKLSKIFT